MTTPAATDSSTARVIYRPLLLAASLGVIFLSLVALIVVPIVVQDRIDALRAEIDRTADPARERVEALRYHVAREMALARGYALEGDSSFLVQYHAMRDRSRDFFTDFAPEALTLSSAIGDRYDSVAVAVDDWHLALAADPVLTGVRAPADVESDAFSRGLYERALSAIDALEDTLDADVAGREARIRGMERGQMLATLGLGILALLSATLVGWLAVRVRHFAEQAEIERAATLRAARARERLIRGVSHDLKNPLTIIDGYAELMEVGLKGELNPDQRETVGRIRRAVGDVLVAVRELMELASAESGAPRLERQAIDVPSLLHQLAADYTAVARAEGIRFSVEQPATALPIPHADVRRVRQILENLVGNALKYTPSGGAVSLSAHVEQGHGTARSIAFSVRDTGPGIPADRREDVFEEFVRLDNAAGTRGSGVGLAISRNLARLMGGDVTVAEAPGGGADFTLWLPLRASD